MARRYSHYVQKGRGGSSCQQNCKPWPHNSSSSAVLLCYFQPEDTSQVRGAGRTFPCTNPTSNVHLAPLEVVSFHCLITRKTFIDGVSRDYFRIQLPRFGTSYGNRSRLARRCLLLLVYLALEQPLFHLRRRYRISGGGATFQLGGQLTRRYICMCVCVYVCMYVCI